MFDHSQGVETTRQTPAIRNPFELQEALEEDRVALLALGELLGTASLSPFDPGACEKGSLAHHISQNLRRGLSRLINLCVESQTRTIDSYTAQYKDSDAYLLERAESALRAVEDGAFRPDRRHEELLKTIGLTKIVLQRRGQLADTAKALETRIVSTLKKCQDGKGSQKQPAGPHDQQGNEGAA